MKLEAEHRSLEIYDGCECVYRGFARCVRNGTTEISVSVVPPYSNADAGHDLILFAMAAFREEGMSVHALRFALTQALAVVAREQVARRNGNGLRPTEDEAIDDLEGDEDDYTDLPF